MRTQARRERDRTAGWRRASTGLAAAIGVIALATACTSGTADPSPTGSVPSGSQSDPDSQSTTAEPDTSGPAATNAPFRDPWIDESGPVTVTSAGAQEIATSLEAPWSVVRLASGATLVSERDSGRVLEVLADGTTREVVTVAGVAHGGEGGLLGLTAWEPAAADGSTDTDAGTGTDTDTDTDEPSSSEGGALFAMFTAEDSNRIVRFDLTATETGGVAVGAPTEIVTGIPRASNHNGGRIAIGPDGMLYATAGDAGQADLAQDQNSLAGKILRFELDGSVPQDNPFGNAVYSMGHRNPQGLAWDRDGRLWASEFGQDTWDELNLIEPGANYGWPTVEGIGDDAAFVNPILQWSTSEASPSGLVWVRDTLFMASLRGERLWRIDVSGAEAVAEPLLVGEYGRLRDVIAGPAESIWIVTNNTDGRGSPAVGDDRIVQLPVTSA